ncbi:uncharacterized protein DUF3325 [Sphingomonas sp. PP-F2F-G114-C0414]|uniref:DUF3325 domain-containing protein n=1 Tax=Sphingomonas sp. PP-F2F-G114-C0414 TaxID=2135662 RepID=UPI000EF8C2AA|nr:DUF3325 domain-containing protein [Sphingomonas sp. PP-F2F-G114-C0414]RMB35852.1 uncharacterized protein DUF3325 [Sphingomonas sp. PP-F2F-G114-C0414]
MIALPLILSIAAFLSLGLSTDAHHRRRFGAGPTAGRRRALRWVGWLGLGAAFLPAILARGWMFGPILWVAAIMAGAAIAFLVLNLVPDPRSRA